MIAVNATDLKNRLGEYLEQARTEPVSVQKNGRDVAVLLSADEYRKLTAESDAYWGLRADIAMATGTETVGHDDAMRMIQAKLSETEAVKVAA